MESNDRRQRQSNGQSYTGAAQQNMLQQSPQFASGTPADRYRQPAAAPQQSPVSAAPTNRRDSSAATYGAYGYGDGAQFVSTTMAAAALPYAPDYTTDAAARQQQQSQQYGQYSNNIMYSLPSQQQAQSPTAYDSVPAQNYQQQANRQQQSAMDVLSGQFGGMQTQYYSPSAGDAHSNPPSATMPTHNVLPQFSNPQYSPQTPVATSLGSYAAANMQEPPSPQVSSPQYASQPYTGPSVSESQAAYAQYQAELRRTNELAHGGRLAEAGSSVLNITQWLLGNAEGLGLVRDDEGAHAERLQLWENFNHCWLAVLQKQQDVAGHVARTGQDPPTGPQALIDVESLKKMGNEVIRLCDIMEKHGLVDYQMGVWEESILEGLMRCLDIAEEQADSPRPNNVVPNARLN